jgi:hypothetical protein
VKAIWKRRLGFLLTFLLVIGIPSGWMLRTYWCMQADRALIEAIKFNDTDRALAALHSGADANARGPVLGEDPSNAPPLTLQEYFQRFYDKLTHPNAKPKPDGHMSALSYHIWKTSEEDLRLVHALLDAGAEPYLPDGEDAYSPVTWALDGNHPQTLRLLLERKIKPQLKDTCGQTILHLAARSSIDPTDLSLLLNTGVDCDAQDNFGCTPLHEACRSAHLQIVLLLLQHHANANIRDKEGRTPLDLAVNASRGEEIELLRRFGGKAGKELDAQVHP